MERNLYTNPSNSNNNTTNGNNNRTNMRTNNNLTTPGTGTMGPGTPRTGMPGTSMPRTMTPGAGTPATGTPGAGMPRTGTPNGTSRMNGQPMNSYVRLLHAVPNAPAVDIYANNALLARDLAFGEATDYAPIPSNNYNIRIFPSGKTDTPVIDTDIFVPANTVLTVAAIGTLPEISLYPIQEPPNGQHSGESCVRFVHLSPDAPSVDINTSDGTTVFSNIAFEGISNYVCVNAGTYTFDVAPTGTTNTVLTVPDVNLEKDKFYTIYAIGLVNGTPELEAILLDEPRYM